MAGQQHESFEDQLPVLIPKFLFGKGTFSVTFWRLPLASVYMKIFFWNVRGLCGTDRQRSVRRWVNDNNVSVGTFLETHTRDDNILSVISSTLPGWRFDSNLCQSSGGRIIVVWDPAVLVMVLSRSEQMLFCSVLDPVSETSFSAAFVYAFNTEGQRHQLWRDLQEISSHHLTQRAPLVVLGDFNQILTATEHFSILPYPLPVRGMCDFQACLNQCDLADVETRGTFFTWTNNRPEDPILRKSDRVLGHSKWRETFPDVVAQFGAQGDSDHSPCLLDLSSEQYDRRSRFIYFSFLATHPKFLQVIEDAWNLETQVGSTMFTLSKKLKNFRAACRKLNKEGFENIQQKTKEAWAKLQEVQINMMTSPSPASFREEFIARKNWRFFERP